MFSPEKDDDMVACPYNKYHQMARKRLQPHLIKCRLSYPDVELCKCPFNASHLVPEPEFTHHVSTCPDKALITQYKYTSAPLKPDEHHKQDEVDCDENWDDTEANDYDPQKYASQAKVIRAHIGDLPSNRKEFRKNERKRLGDVHSSDEEVEKAFGKKIYKDYDSKVKAEEKESKWFEDTGPSSSSRNSKRDDDYERFLKKYARDRGLDSPERRPVKTEKEDDYDDRQSKKRVKEEYPLDEDPYYRSNNVGMHYRGAGNSRNGHRRHY